MEADIKIVIVDRVQSGQLQKKIDEMLKIPKSTVIYICRKYSDAGFFGKTIERQQVNNGARDSPQAIKDC